MIIIKKILRNEMNLFVITKSDKAQQVQQQVDEVVGIMQDNIQKVMDRGERLDTLQVKTEDLQQQSSNFKRGANRVRKQMWWKDMKLKIILGVIVGLIILFILIKLFGGLGGGDDEQKNDTNN
ncbi:synaptobrevin [Neocallimastix sp. 'constans']